MKRNPKDSESSSRTISRRTLVLGGLQLGAAGVLAARMRYLQVDQADQYRLLAEENRIDVRLLAPARGLIFDRKGTLIAGNEQNYRIVITREEIRDFDEIITRLSFLVPLDGPEIERARKELNRRSNAVTVADRLTWDQLAQVAANAPALPGVSPEVGLSRYYPLGSDFAHLVGYVGRVSERDLAAREDPDPLFSMPKFQIGKTGAEAKLEDALRGQAGTRRVEVDVKGRIMRELDRREGRAGAAMQLTIDADLQAFAQARLTGESASAVVMDLESGDIVALGSAPSFDPNLFVRGISTADYAKLTENIYRPLSNKSVQGTYPPGSTFKMVTVLAALEAGVVDATETVNCPGYYELGDRRFHCWSRGGHGRVDLEKSLSQSCDVYYYDIAARVGIDKIAEMAKRLGLGQSYDLPLSAIAEGLTPNKDWKARRYGTDWRIGDTLNAGIGQGYVLASPLQLAVMTARLATGRGVIPRLIKSIDGIETPVLTDPAFSINENHLRMVRKGMQSVINDNRGTAHGSRLADAAFRYAGKTGTSQVRNISATERADGVTSNADLPWERRDHALFVGYGPVEAPRYAISLVVEHGGGGSSAAAPLARDILLFAMNGGLPPLSAYPESQRGTIRSIFESLPAREESAPSAERAQT